MKIIIEIDEDIAQRIINGKKEEPMNTVQAYPATIAYAIQEGVVLPKGHGRLIAEPTEEDIAKTVGGQNDFAESIRDAVKAVFDNAQTIVRADKESEE